MKTALGMLLAASLAFAVSGCSGRYQRGVKFFDRDGDGRVSQLEWDGRFKEADTNTDGFLTVEEVKAYAKKSCH